ncbi:mCG1026328 [Mus musculus]|nr:mCG1026328 [Mus musculus]
MFTGVLLDYVYNICCKHFKSNDKWTCADCKKTSHNPNS